MFFMARFRSAPARQKQSRTAGQEGCLSCFDCRAATPHGMLVKANREADTENEVG
jgi:ribosomal protein S26